MNIFFQYFAQALTNILPWILWSFVWIKFNMVDLLPFLFAQIDKILSVRMNISQHQWTLFSNTLHMYYLQSSHESCEVSSGSNSKWSTNCHFCLLKLPKYLKILSFRMNISNTNEYLFLILYTCINYNPPMYPYNYQQSILPGGGYHCVSDILVHFTMNVTYYKTTKTHNFSNSILPPL